MLERQRENTVSWDDGAKGQKYLGDLNRLLWLEKNFMMEHEESKVSRIKGHSVKVKICSLSFFFSF